MNKVDSSGQPVRITIEMLDQKRQAIGDALQDLKVKELGRLIPVVAIAAAIGSIAVILAQENLQTSAPTDQARVAAGMVVVGLCIIAVIAILGSLLLQRRFPEGWLQNPEQSQKAQMVKSFLVSIMIGILLSIGSPYLAVWQNRNHGMEWYRYEFFDKRWLFYLYWIVVLAFLILPPFIYRTFLEKPTGEFSPDTTPLREKSKLELPRKRNITATVLKLVLALIVSYFFFGPPWNIQRTSLEINYHEQVHLGPIQAIDKGYLPGIGPASQQYGPGTQLLTYAFMKLSGQFNLVGFRTAHGFNHLLGYTIFAMMAFLLLRPSTILLAILLSLFLSPFALTNWTSAGGLAIWGWPNPLRYAGAVILLASMPYILFIKDKNGLSQLATIGAGFIWGIFCWIAQENLMIGIVAGILFALLMWSTRTISGKRILKLGLLITFGFFLAWIPIATFYIYHATFVEYLKNYFLVGGQVINGATNIPLGKDLLENPLLLMTLIFAVPLLILIGVLALLDNRTVFHPLSMKRSRFLALVIVAIACFFGALTRTDSPHLLNTLFVFPIVMALAYQDMPEFIFNRESMGSNMTILLIIILLALILFNANRLEHQMKGRFQRFSFKESALGRSITREDISWGRIGFPTLPEQAPFHLDPEIEIRELLEALDLLHKETEGQNVFVHSFPYSSPGLVYFFADLTPPGIYLDPSTMVFSEDVKEDFLTHFKGIVDTIDFIVTKHKNIPEVKIYLERNPEAYIREYSFFDQTFYLIGTHT